MKKLKENVYHNNGVYQEPFFKPYKPCAVHHNLVEPEEGFCILGSFLGSKKDFLNKLYKTNENGFFVEPIPSPFLLDEDAEMAKDCGLLPFHDKGTNIHLILGCPDGEIARLDAYQVLTHGTIDRQSTFFTDKEHFTSIVGKDIVDQMEKILYEDQSV